MFGRPELFLFGGGVISGDEMAAPGLHSTSECAEGLPAGGAASTAGSSGADGGVHGAAAVAVSEGSAFAGAGSE